MSVRRYFLDTNILSDLVRHPQGTAARHVERVGYRNVSISIIVACEARFGVLKSGSERLARQLELILTKLEMLPLKSPVESHYAEIRRHLERAGTPIGPNDLIIAAHARALGYTLVTHNVSEFQRVPGLEVENWLI